MTDRHFISKYVPVSYGNAIFISRAIFHLSHLITADSYCMVLLIIIYTDIVQVQVSLQVLFGSESVSVFALSLIVLIPFDMNAFH